MNRAQATTLLNRVLKTHARLGATWRPSDDQIFKARLAKFHEARLEFLNAFPPPMECTCGDDPRLSCSSCVTDSARLSASNPDGAA